MSLEFDTTVGGDTLILTTLGTSWEVLNEAPQMNEEGWDTCTISVACRREETSPYFAFDDWPIGAQIVGRNLYVSNVKPVCFGGVWKADISTKGILDTDRAWKLKINATSDQRELKDVIVATGESAIYNTIQVTDSAPAVSVSFVRTSGVPATDKIGTNVDDILDATGVSFPAVKDALWGGGMTYHFPNGWVLGAVDADEIPGTGVYFETWEISYQPKYTP